MRAVDDNIDGAAVARSLQAKQTNSSTKRTYQSKIKGMTEWLAVHYPDSVDSTNLMRVPLPKEAIIGFFGHICSPAHSCSLDNVHADESPSVPLSSSIWGFRSALVDAYRAKLIELDPQIDTELQRVLEGYEKVINGLKKSGLMKISEGKRDLKASGFELLALKSMKDAPSRIGQAWGTVLFSWSYFVLMWNLMSRSDSIDIVMLQHVEWAEDYLSVEEQGHKGDQKGSEKFGKHVFANPFVPSRCSILAIAVHLFPGFERTVTGKQQLFIGTDNKNRFDRALHRVISALNEDEMRVLGCNPDDIGTHSIRKGSSSYALGQVNGPTPVSVYLGMGQSLGKLKDRYIHFGQGADQLCGRMIAVLPFYSERLPCCHHIFLQTYVRR